MSYSNPLHAPVRASNYSSFTSIGPSSSFQSSSRKRVPQESALAKQCAGSKRLERPVFFDFIGYAGQGVPMCELSSRSAGALQQMITGASDAVFLHMHAQNIVVRIMWPGYSDMDWAKPIALHSPRGLITRAQLGATIAIHFARFIEKAQFELTRASEWRVGPGAIGFEHLVLVALWNVADDVWQADIAFDRR